MKVVLLIVAAVAVPICVVLIVGALLPAKHVASREIVVRRLPAEVFAVVRDFASAPGWRTDLETVEMLNAVDGRVRFREESSNGRITYEVMEERAGEKLVTRIVDRDLGYFGSWTYEFLRAEGGALVRITEKAEVPNLLFRFLSRFVFGHTATMDGYLRALGRKLEEEVAPK